MQGTSCNGPSQASGTGLVVDIHRRRPSNRELAAEWLRQIGVWEVLQRLEKGLHRTIECTPVEK